MFNLKPFLLLCACTLMAQAPMPPLRPGEALALSSGDKENFFFGDVETESPMGTLAYLPWLRLEGDNWSRRRLQFKCTGVLNGEACSQASGHGKVNLPQAIEKGCDLAMLYWIRLTALDWHKEEGDGVARVRLEEAFGPFLGSRMPIGQNLPPMDGTWLGSGNLLRTSPAQMLAWLTDPNQEQLLRNIRRLMMNELKETYMTGAWWVLGATSEVALEPGVYSSWAVGSNGSGAAVLHLPAGKTRAEALARFQEIMIGPTK
jgi:hypothetical protein